MALSPDGTMIVNTSETTNMAHLIDTATRKIIANVLVDARPRFAAFKPDDSELWVSPEIGGTVTVIDPATRKITDKIIFAIPGLRRRRSSRSASASPRTARPPSSRSAPPTASP